MGHDDGMMRYHGHHKCVFVANLFSVSFFSNHFPPPQLLIHPQPYSFKISIYFLCGSPERKEKKKLVVVVCV